MKKGQIFVIFALFFSFFSQVANAQGNVAILFGGSFPVGQLKDLDGMKADGALFPGLEARFNENGRVSFGASYQKWKLKQDPIQVSFPVSRNGNQEFVTWDESASAKGNVMFATIYINLITRGKVRPFVGGGPGVGMFRTSTHIRNVMDVVPPFFEKAGDQKISKKETRIMAKGIAGLNFYPAKHFVLSVSGGYINGPAVSLGIGTTF
ncbi:MAG: hypothetical protein Q8Q06_01500 [bacterium]|nr:hypothetical protein [bacterium]